MIVQTAADVYLEEADQLLEKGDVVQASEKYYKAAEEAVKLLAKSRGLRVVREVEARRLWDTRLLFEAANTISERLYRVWRDALYLHVMGFHEMKLNLDEVRRSSISIHELVEILGSD